MRQLLNDKKVQIGLGAAVAVGVVWFLLAGGDSVEEANTTETTTEQSEVVAPATVNEAVDATETNTNNADVTTTNETTNNADNTNQ